MALNKYIAATPELLIANMQSRSRRCGVAALMTGAMFLGVAHDTDYAVASPLHAPVAADQHQKPHTRKAQCRPDRQISFKLYDQHAKSADGAEKYTFVAKACRRTIPEHLTHVTVKEIAPDGQIETWRKKHFKAGHAMTRRFNLSAAEASDSNTSYTPVQNKTLVFKALSKHKKIGYQKFTMRWDAATKSYGLAPQTTANTPYNPVPNPIIGLEDEPLFMNHEYDSAITPAQAYNLAPNLGATAMRIIVTYGEFKANPQKFLDTMQAANDHNLKVVADLVGTPRYAPGQDQTVSYLNHKDQDVKDFGKEAAEKFKGLVWMYGMWNEPNLGGWLEPSRLDTYLDVFKHLREGVLDGDPAAQTMIGDLAPSSRLDEWVPTLSRQPANMLAIHAYGITDRAAEIMNMVGGRKPVIATEFGVPASDPNQKLKLSAGIHELLDAGLEGVSYYQVIENPNKPWNTGFIAPSEVAQWSDPLR
jgi:hypothetical protein